MAQIIVKLIFLRVQLTGSQPEKYGEYPYLKTTWFSVHQISTDVNMNNEVIQFDSKST